MNVGRALVALRWKKTSAKKRTEQARARALSVPEEERKARMSALAKARWAKRPKKQ